LGIRGGILEEFSVSPVGWVKQSATQPIKVRNGKRSGEEKGNVGFRFLNPTYKIGDRTMKNYRVIFRDITQDELISNIAWFIL
jgi:hypothetical protein